MTTKYLGLLMSDEMALACHKNRKTVTRRPIAVQPRAVEVIEIFDGRFAAKAWFPVDGGALAVATTAPTRDAALMDVFCPAIIPGAGTATVGGRVWIRECWAPMCRVADPTCFCEDGAAHFVEYRADTGNARPGEWPSGVPAGDGVPKWRPSIHMPKWAARTWGRIVSVRPERLQDITDDDARREGCTDGLAAAGMLPHVAAFRSVWNDCYAAMGLGWDANPWVWRIEWERIERPQEDR